MTDDDAIFIIGCRAEGRTSYPVPGTRVIECENCHTGTLFSPSSLNRPEATRASFICMVCAEAMTSNKPIAIAPLTTEQAQEIFAALEKDR